MRRTARESVFKLMFEYTFYQTRNDDTLEIMLLNSDLTEDDKDYINRTYNGMIADQEILKETISSKLASYKLERVYRPDFVALMLAVYELREKSVPQAVVINEAVELAKRYGTEKSGSFVNGVLGKIAEELK
ncbi:MAG: transcription antitermination factor NusB [Clostridia bacterium]